MKNLTNRTKILLGIAGLVIVVIVAGVVILGPGATGLFGTTGTYIDPPSLCLLPGSTRTLTEKGTLLGVNSWSSESTAIATVTKTGTKTANVTGVGIGDTYVKAKGTFFSDIAMIYVNHVCPYSQEISPNTSIKAVTDLTGRTWFSRDPAIASVGSDGTVHGKSLGTTIICYGVLDTTCEGEMGLIVTNTPRYRMSW